MATCAAPLVNLACTCALMFVGALGAGYLPLMFELGKNKASLMSGVGAGFLLGSVLGVVIPEGFEALQEVSAGGQVEDGAHEHNLDWRAGCSLLVGFVLMMGLDYFASSHKHCSMDIHQDDNGKEQDSEHLLFGLMIHSVTDGLAVGIAALAPDTCIGLGVGLAMVLHKVPVAFGFSAYLKQLRLPLQRIHGDLVAFACSSPIAAIAIYSVHGLLPNLLGSTNIGYLLLFSGGTFLFVACTHIIPSFLTNNESASRQQLIAVGGLYRSANCVFMHGSWTLIVKTQ